MAKLLEPLARRRYTCLCTLMGGVNTSKTSIKKIAVPSKMKELVTRAVLFLVTTTSIFRHFQLPFATRQFSAITIPHTRLLP